MKISGSIGFILKEKLKCLKGLLKVWNKEIICILDLDVDNVLESLKNLDSLSSSIAYSNSLSEAK